MNFVPVFQKHVLDGQWDLQELVDKSGTLALTLNDDRARRITISFDSYMAYRKLNEGDALLTLSSMRKTSGTAKYFYRVEDSAFTVWFNQERFDSEPVHTLVHYCIAATNDIIDILALEPPVIDAR